MHRAFVLVFFLLGLVLLRSSNAAVVDTLIEGAKREGECVFYASMNL